MSRYTAHASQIQGTASRQRRLAHAPSIVFAGLLLVTLVTMALMAHWSVEGAASPATLSIIGETFDKGF